MRMFILLCVILIPRLGSSRDFKPYLKDKVWSRSAIIEKILDSSERRGLDPSVTVAVAEIESRFNPRAIRWEKHLKTASVGLYQILHTTARKEFGFKGSIQNLMHPAQNIRMGLDYLERCGTTNLTRLACCYQAGFYASEKFCANNKGVQDYTRNLKNTVALWDSRLKN